MIVLYILGGLLLAVLLALSIPVGFRIHYAEDLTASVRVLGVRIQLYPENPSKQPPKEKQRKPKKQQPSSEEKPRSAVWSELSAALKENGVVATLAWLKEMADILSRAAGRVVRAITIRKLRLRLDIAGEDAAAAAETYGKVCAALYPTLGMLCSLLRIRRQEVQVAPAFLQETHTVQMDIRGHICPLRVVWAALCALVKGLVSFLSFTSRGKEPTTIKEAVKHG